MSDPARQAVHDGWAYEAFLLQLLEGAVLAHRNGLRLPSGEVHLAGGEHALYGLHLIALRVAGQGRRVFLAEQVEGNLIAVEEEGLLQLRLRPSRRPVADGGSHDLADVGSADGAVASLALAVLGRFRRRVPLLSVLNGRGRVAALQVRVLADEAIVLRALLIAELVLMSSSTRRELTSA